MLLIIFSIQKGIEIEPETVELEHQIQQQNELYFELYDNLGKNVSYSDRKELLNINKQAVPEEQVRSNFE